MGCEWVGDVGYDLMEAWMGPGVVRGAESELGPVGACIGRGVCRPDGWQKAWRNIAYLASKRFKINASSYWIARRNIGEKYEETLESIGL